MIVECDKCHAKFRLDDSKITERGVKVRCSKCKNVFTVTKQSTQAEDKTVISSAPPPPPPPPPPAEPSFIPPTPSSPPPEDDFGGFEFRDEPTPPPAPPPAKEEAKGDTFGDFDFSDTDLSFSSKVEEKPSAKSFEEEKLTFDEEPPAKAGASAVSEEGAEQDDFGDFDFEDEVSADSSAKLKEETFDALGGDIPDLGAKPASPAKASELDSDFGADDFGADDFDLGMEEPAPPPSTAGAGREGGIDEYGDISLDDLGGGGGGVTPSAPKEKEELDVAGEFQLDTAIGGRSEKEFKESIGGGVDSYAFNGGSSEALDVDIPLKVGRAPAHEPAPQTLERPRPVGKPPTVAVEKSKGGGKKFVAVLVIICAIGGGGFYLNKQGKINLKEISLSNLSVDGIKKILGLKKEELPRGIWEIPKDQIRLYKIERKDKKTIWVMRGKITSRFLEVKKTIRIEGTIVDGEVTISAQAIVGNKISDEQLASLPINAIMDTVLNTVPLDENNDPFFMQTDQTADFVIVFEKVSSAQPKLADKPVKVVDAVTL